MTKSHLYIAEPSKSIGYYLDLEGSLIHACLLVNSCASASHQLGHYHSDSSRRFFDVQLDLRQNTAHDRNSAPSLTCEKILRMETENTKYESILMLWSVGPTVIYGRNQSAEAEVNLEYCRENGIEVYQRHSGGGAVYADEGNLMVSWITPCESVAKTFGEFLERFASALRSCGIECSVSGRNDICVGSRKISGNAFYKVGNYAIVHGTLLWDVNLSALEKSITPSAEKLASKGIKSVRSRVVNLRELYPDLSLGKIREAIIKEFC